MDDLFKRTMTDIDMYSKVLKSLAERAMQLGLAPKNVTVQTAHLKVDGAVNRLLEAEATAKELGYKSLPTALKALSQYKDNQSSSLNKLPEVFHTVPHGWIYGKADSAPNKQDGWKPLSLSQAQRRHRTITPLLIEAWELTDGDDETRNEIEYFYRTVSDVDFEKELYTYIHRLEPLPLEEQFKRVIPTTPEDLKESLRLVTDPDIIYGVVKKKKKKDTED